MGADGCTVSDEERLSVRGVLQRTLTGSIYSILGQGVTTVSGLARSILIARLLRVEEIGLVALALFFSNFLFSISSFGLNQSLIQREKLCERAIATHFVLRMSLALVGFGLTLAVWPLLGVVYADRPQLAAAVVGLGAVQLLMAAVSTPMSLLNRRLLYRRLMAINVVSSLLTLFTAPLMAWTGWGIWSLIIGEQLVGALISLVGLWLWRPPWRLSLRGSRALARDYLNFGKFVLASHQLTFLLDQFDDFWTGTYLGDSALGFYSKAYEFARYPRRLITRPFQSILFSTFSRLQNDRVLLGKAFQQSLGIIVRVNFLFSCVLFVLAPTFVPWLLGEAWRPMVVPFRLMLVYVLLDPILSTAADLTVALGRPSVMTRVRFVQLLVFVPAVIVGGNAIGVNGIAIAADTMIFVGLLGVLVVIRGEVAISFSAVFLAPLLAGSLATTIGLWITWGSVSPFIALILSTSIMSLVYIVVLAILEWRKFGELAQQVRRFRPPKD